MFTKIRLQNFRSFGNIEFDLTQKNGSPKNLAIVYGENGAGKSNLMYAFVLLNELLLTMNIRDAYEEFLNQKAIFTDEKVESLMRNKIRLGLRDIKAIIDDCRMVGNDDAIVAEYEFLIDGREGKYCVHFGKDEIQYEKLEFTLNKRRGTYYECSNEGIKINSGIVKSKEFFDDFKNSAKRFWGKHSMLAIILHEMNDKAKSYGEDNISQYFSNVLYFFRSLSGSLKIGTKEWKKAGISFGVLEHPEYGNIDLDDEKQLDLVEQILTKFFHSINSDIKKAYYKKTYDDKEISYNLMFEKLISGKYRQIDFSQESTGNHQVLRIFSYLFVACCGDVVALDEADSGVHDLLFKKIIEEVYPLIEGQIIITTHNTMLMETEFGYNSTYILKEDEEGNKEIKAISDYEKRTYSNNNIRNKYLNKEYKGVPKIEEIDFKNLFDKIFDVFTQ